MMMHTDIRFLNPHQIGGCVTVIAYGDTKIVIDYGKSLSAGGRLQESIDWEEERVDAVFFTHYHGDHTGRLDEIPDRVPLYMGAVTRDVIINIHSHLSIYEKDNNEHAAIISRLAAIPPERLLRADRTVSVGHAGACIRVTPYVVDHSAYEAHMLLVETPDKVILHTGDFRGHGYIGDDGRTMLRVIDKYVRRYGARDVDVLITEGTMMGRQDGEIMTEAELKRRAESLFKDNPYVFLICSSVNLDSLASFYHAMRKSRPYSAMYGSRYFTEQLSYLCKTASKRSSVYDLEKRYPYLAGDKGSEAFIQKQRAQRQLMLRNGFITVIRPEERYEEWVAPFMDRDPLFVYSMWNGYLDETGYPDACNREWISFQKRHKDRWVSLHTPGHASPKLIRDVIHAAGAKETVYTIHTEYPERVKALGG